MGNLLYTIAILLVMLRAIGFLGYTAGGVLHIILVIALVSVILRIIQEKKYFKIN